MLQKLFYVFWVGQGGHINILKVLNWDNSGNMFKLDFSEGAL